MSTSIKWHRIAQVSILVLLALGVLVRFFVRAPEGTSVAEIYDQVEVAGRARQVVSETVQLVRAVAEVDDSSDSATKAALLANANRTKTAAEDLRFTIQQTSESWIQLDESAERMTECANILQRAIDRVLISTEVSLENPALIETAADNVGILRDAAEKLDAGASSDSIRMKQELATAVFAEGTLLGFTTADLLLGGFALTALIGVMTLIQASRRLKTPLAKLERAEIELVGRSDRLKAVRQCHQRVEELLELAGGFCRGERL